MGMKFAKSHTVRDLIAQQRSQYLRSWDRELPSAWHTNPSKLCCRQIQRLTQDRGDVPEQRLGEGHC